MFRGPISPGRTLQFAYLLRRVHIGLPGVPLFDIFDLRLLPFTLICRPLLRWRLSQIIHLHILRRNTTAGIFLGSYPGGLLTAIVRNCNLRGGVSGRYFVPSFPSPSDPDDSSSPMYSFTVSHTCSSNP